MRCAGQSGFDSQLCVLAVTDMFFDLPFDLDDNDEQCLDQFGIHAQYNWAAYK